MQVPLPTEGDVRGGAQPLSKARHCDGAMFRVLVQVIVQMAASPQALC